MSVSIPVVATAGGATGSLRSVSERSWLLEAVGVVARHPVLWPTAIAQVVRLAAPGWWRRRPFLPLPSPGYLHLRITTMYGGDGTAPIVADDLVTWLRWCRADARR